MTTQQHDDELRELVASMPLALVPLITRSQAARVLLGVLRGAAKHGSLGNLPKGFFKDFGKMRDWLKDAVRSGWGSRPIFAPVKYRGALTYELSPYGQTVAKTLFPDKIILTQGAGPFAFAHELTHYLTMDPLFSPRRTYLMAKPFIEYYSDPVRKREVYDRYLLYLLPKTPDLLRKLGYADRYAEYASSPFELLANAVAARIAEPPTVGTSMAQQIVEPQFDPLIDYLANLIAPLR